jgi:hypothetical protein
MEEVIRGKEMKREIREERKSKRVKEGMRVSVAEGI